MVGVKKRKTTSYTYSQNLWATSKESTPHSSKRGLFTFQERLAVHRTPSHMEKRALVNTEILSHFPIYSSNISFIPLALYESFLETQEVHGIAPLKLALPTHNRILNTALLTLSPLPSSFKKHFGAPCKILLLHSTPSTKSEVAERWALCLLLMMAWLYVTHRTFRLFTNPHSSFLLSLMLFENLTAGSFIWTRPSKTRLPLAVDDQMKYSRVELSSVKP